MNGGRMGFIGDGQFIAPAIDNQRMSKAAKCCVVIADLVGGDEEALIFNRPSAN